MKMEMVVVEVEASWFHLQNQKKQKKKIEESVIEVGG